MAMDGKRCVCYITNWSQYRPGQGKFVPSNIDPFLCTHIVYAFAKLEGNCLAKFEWNDEEMYKETMALKRRNPELKVLLSVGGWNMGSAPFNQMVASASSQREFSETAVSFLRKYDFDGLDLDWEYPQDKRKYAELVEALAHAFQNDSRDTRRMQLLLCAAVSAGKEKIDSVYDFQSMSMYMDFITLMTYDFHGTWETRIGHHAQLFQRNDERGTEGQFNIAWAANYWASKVGKGKLNVGLALYGRGFQLSDPSNHRPGAPASGSSAAREYTRESGYASYYEIRQMIKSGGQVHRLKDAKVPYLVKGNEWFGYDDPQSLEYKASWTKEQGYGGVATWALPLDDFNNICGDGKYPLMKAIVRGLKH